MSENSLDDIIRDTMELVKQAAHPRTGMLKVSPEVAALFEGIAASPVGASSGDADAPDTNRGVALAEDLEGLAEQVRACTLCDLCKGRTQTVFSDGSSTADLVFVGEAPGENEDKQGIPFCGRSGDLLTDIIVKGMKLRREDVYICNVIKCRPPNNRDPLPAEKDSCEPYLVRQLELVKPKVICALGGHAAKTLLKTDESTGRLRGKWHFYHGIPLRVTYHPAYLLRSPGEKKKTWEDVQEIMKVLSGEITPTP
ncbi:MAG: uracil-DNA glycosylase [Candidatus Hydrogenedentota bacterium]